jgi:GxxExxY protein
MGKGRRTGNGMMNLETKKPGEELGNRDLTERIIGAAIRVHTELGPGFLESIYEEALGVELRLLGLSIERQKPVPIFYRGQPIGEHRLDLLVQSSVVVELKAISALEKIHFAIVRSYLKAPGLNDGLLLNFAGTRLAVKRIGREYQPHNTENISL